MLGKAEKETGMRPTEFPRMQIPYSHDMAEKLVMAKVEPKRKKVVATHLFFTL